MRFQRGLAVGAICTVFAATLLGFEGSMADTVGAEVPGAGGLSRGPVQVVHPDTSESDRTWPQNSLVVDPAGIATALWTHDGTLWASQSRPGGSWETPQALGCADPADRVCLDPELATSADGSVTAVWESEPSGSGVAIFGGPGKRILVAHKARGAPWSRPTDLTAAVGVAWGQDPHVLASPGGRVWVWWEKGYEYTGRRVRTFVVQSPAPGDWSGASATVLDDAAEPEAGLTGDGGIVLAARGTHSYQLRAYRYHAGTGWGRPQRVGTAGYVGEDQPGYDIAAGPGSRATIVWAEPSQDPYPASTVMARGLSPAGELRAPRRLSRRDIDGTPGVHLTEGSDGSWTAAWYDSNVGRDQDDDRVRVVRKAPGRPWHRTSWLAGPDNRYPIRALISNQVGDTAIMWGARVALRPVGGPWTAPRLSTRTYSEDGSLAFLAAAALRVLYDDAATSTLARDLFIRPRAPSAH